MRERARRLGGELLLGSGMGTGTRLELTFPEVQAHNEDRS